MAHIPHKERAVIDQSPVANCPINTSRELAYAVSVLAGSFLKSTKDRSRYNEIVGALESAKQHVYDELVAPYERQQKHDNGEIQY